MSEVDWAQRLSAATRYESLLEICEEARSLGEWNERLADHARARAAALQRRLRPFGTDVELEQRIRDDERLKVLREVRKGAAAVDRSVRGVDAYLWGYGANEIVKQLNKLVAEQRKRMGLTVEHQPLSKKQRAALSDVFKDRA